MDVEKPHASRVCYVAHAARVWFDEHREWKVGRHTLCDVSRDNQTLRSREGITVTKKVRRTDIVQASIFFDFSLPNSATWFYFSFLLAIALFFRFDRLLSLRNWDLLALYMVIPGVLCLQEAHALKNFLDGAGPNIPDADDFRWRSKFLLLIGYSWLMVGAFYYFVRCVFDLGLEKRPALAPNMNVQGLSCLAIALLVCLTVVAIRRMPDSPEQVGRGPIALTKVQDGATAVVSYQSGLANLSEADAKFWVSRGVAISLHVSVAVALVLIGLRHFNDAAAGVGMACLYLMLPCTAYHVSQVHHVWPVVFILWALYCYKNPFWAGVMLGIASGSAFFPVLMFPLWFGFYRGRGTGKFSSGFCIACGLSLAITAVMLLWTRELKQYLNVALSLSDWQPWKAPKTESIWTGSHWAYRLPVFIAYMAFIVLTMFWPKPRNLAQVIAQSAAVAIGVQFWYADQGGVYLAWYAPLLLLMIFRPNLTDVRPPELNGKATTWLGRQVKRSAKWLRIIGDKHPPAASTA